MLDPDRVKRLLAVTALAWLALAGPSCKSSGSKDDKPSGTTSDPVETCERVADVCRLDDARLGVCIQAPDDARPPRCKAGEPCYVCAPQH